MAYNSFAMTSKAALIKYLHQAAFSPQKQTKIKAINKECFSTRPGFTTQAVPKYLLDSALATDNGHTTLSLVI